MGEARLHLGRVLALGNAGQVLHERSSANLVDLQDPELEDRIGVLRWWDRRRGRTSLLRVAVAAEGAVVGGAGKRMFAGGAISHTKVSGGLSSGTMPPGASPDRAASEDPPSRG